ncbi:MAG: molybdopterin-dependent oxidoreductase, partial [Chloroflexota bacterium]
MIFTACGVPDRELFVEAPLDLPEDLVDGRDNWYATVASGNGEGLGLVVRVMEGRAKKVAGNPDYPVNLGKQAAHSDTALQALYHPDRLRTPMLRRSKGSPAVPISWAEAEAHLSQWISESEGRLTVATDPVRGGDAQILQQFVDAHSGRLIFFDTFEQGVLHQAVRDVFGQERLPEFDIANAHTVLSFGADWLGTWLSPVRYGVKYGEFRQGHEHRGFMIHAESRMSLTAASADRWLPVAPGHEGELALSIAHVIVNEGLVPEANIQAFTANMPDGALDQYEP